MKCEINLSLIKGEAFAYPASKCHFCNCCCYGWW